MKTLLLIHGPNLNLLGKRDATHYGSLTLASLEQHTQQAAKQFGYEIKSFQSNHEGALIDFIQENTDQAAGIIINPGAFTHYSYALHDALLDAKIPAVEVHLSDVQNREQWRKISVTAPACKKVISGKKELGYSEAVKFLAEYLGASLQ